MEKFINNFANQLFDQTTDHLSNNTIFRELEDWDSLTAMAVIAMIQDEYGVKIDESSFRTLFTIGDLYNYVEENK